jgi:hypothetical protein
VEERFKAFFVPTYKQGDLTFFAVFRDAWKWIRGCSELPAEAPGGM